MTNAIPEPSHRRRLRDGALLLLFLLPFYGHFLMAVLMKSLPAREAVLTAAGALYNLLLFGPLLLWRRRFWMVAIAFWMQALIGTAELYHLALYDAPVGIGTLYLLFEANPNEMREYVGSTFGVMPKVLPFLGMAGIGFWLFRRLARGHAVRRPGLAAAALLLALTPGFVVPRLRNIPARNSLVKLCLSYGAFREEQDRLLRMAQDPDPVIEPVGRSSPYPGREVHVLVIGEATTRNHMALYGYARPTTPRLGDLEARGLIHAFRDVVSPHSHTRPALQKLLSFSNHENPDAHLHKSWMTHYLRKAGFRTYWISNQNPMGYHETFATTVARTCDEYAFVNYTADNDCGSHDGKLLEPFQQILDQPAERKFIFVHLLGTHGLYDRRYPEEFEVFTDAVPGRPTDVSATINAYDNAVLYNDTIVGELIRRLQEVEETSAYLLYLSDHGEDVHDSADFAGHTETVGTRHMFEIPCVLWMSDAYRRHRTASAGSESFDLARAYMTDDLIHTVFDLSGVAAASFEPARSLVHPAFVERDRWIGSRRYERETR